MPGIQASPPVELHLFRVASSLPIIFFSHPLSVSHWEAVDKGDRRSRRGHLKFYLRSDKGLVVVLRLLSRSVFLRGREARSALHSPLVTDNGSLCATGAGSNVALWPVGKGETDTTLKKDMAAVGTYCLEHQCVSTNGRRFLPRCSWGINTRLTLCT